MKCITQPDQLALWGNFDSAVAQNLQLAFELCDNKTSAVPCKSKEEIVQWMRQKFIVVLFNENGFIKHKFQEEKMQM